MERKPPEASTPAAAPSTAAPTPAAPRIGSAAAVLRLQRAAGNRAVLAAMRATAPAPDPVIRRAWRPDLKWDQLVGGVRWQRRNVDGTLEFQFSIEDEDAMPQPLIRSEEDEWHPAEFWHGWKYSAHVWRGELAGAGAGAGAAAPAAARPAAAGGAGGPEPTTVAEASTATSTETAAGAAPAKSAPAKSAPAKAAAGKVPTKATGGGAGGAGGAGKVPTKATAGGAGAGAAAGTGAAAAAAAPAGRRLSPPTVATVGQTQVHPDGAFYWLVRMTAGETVTDDSWIVQHVLMSGDGEADEFWEAFGVPANGTAVTGDDVFEELLDDAAGTRRVTGTMRHYVFPGGIDPPGMSAAGGGHGARGQLTTRTPPDWWTGAGGVAHELTFTWDGATTANLLTVPTSGDPVVKAVRTTVGQL